MCKENKVLARQNIRKLTHSFIWSRLITSMEEIKPTDSSELSKKIVLHHCNYITFLRENFFQIDSPNNYTFILSY